MILFYSFYKKWVHVHGRQYSNNLHSSALSIPNPPLQIWADVLGKRWTMLSHPFVHLGQWLATSFHALSWWKTAIYIILQICIIHSHSFQKYFWISFIGKRWTNYFTNIYDLLLLALPVFSWLIILLTKRGLAFRTQLIFTF